jgi:transcriptional regulator with XRE-family HTH domain
MNIGIKIKRLRENKRMSQMELSTILNISQTKLCNIESNDDKMIDFALMDKVCRYFEVGFDYFLNEKQINKVEKNDGGVVGSNFGTINNFPESILEQITILIEDNKSKAIKIEELEKKIQELIPNPAP